MLVMHLFTEVEMLIPSILNILFSFLYCSPDTGSPQCSWQSLLSKQHSILLLLRSKKIRKLACFAFSNNLEIENQTLHSIKQSTITYTETYSFQNKFWILFSNIWTLKHPNKIEVNTENAEHLKDPIILCVSGKILITIRHKSRLIHWYGSVTALLPRRNDQSVDLFFASVVLHSPTAWWLLAFPDELCENLQLSCQALSV